jgi:hypothetical protein
MNAIVSDPWHTSHVSKEKIKHMTNAYLVHLVLIQRFMGPKWPSGEISQVILKRDDV